MKQVGGVWFPDEDEAFHRFHLKEVERDIPFFLKQVGGRDVVVQAGGAMGLYPLRLAEHFQRVVTFEPDPDNWQCLSANLAARDCLRRVRATQAALGAREGCGVMRPHPGAPTNWGARYVHAVDFGDFPIVCIDSLELPACDAIWLDVEGFELAALKGAVETIMRHSPVIVTEENGNGARFGADEYAIADFLEPLGYGAECGIGRDRYYRRAA